MNPIVRALRAVLGLGGPKQPHQGPLSTPCPWAHRSCFSSGCGIPYSFKLCCRWAGDQPCSWIVIYWSHLCACATLILLSRIQYKTIYSVAEGDVSDLLLIRTWSSCSWTWVRSTQGCVCTFYMFTGSLCLNFNPAPVRRIPMQLRAFAFKLTSSYIALVYFGSAS